MCKAQFCLRDACRRASILYTWGQTPATPFARLQYYISANINEMISEMITWFGIPGFI